MQRVCYSARVMREKRSPQRVKQFCLPCPSAGLGVDSEDGMPFGRLSHSGSVLGGVSSSEFVRLRVLVACENSGIVRDCFSALGHDAWSCDLLDSERPGNHVKKDALEVAFSQKWDVLICHPPCRFLTVANNRNWARFDAEQREAVRLALLLWSAPIKHVCLENPVGFLNTAWMPASQVLHPWQFGHRVQKRTCLWLKNLPALAPHASADSDFSAMRKMRKCRRDRLRFLPQGPNRWKIRSATFPGVAEAMARQWSAFATQFAEPRRYGVAA